MFCFLLAIFKESIASDVSAKGEVKDYMHGLKVISGAPRSFSDSKVGIRHSPSRWVRCDSILFATTGASNAVLQIGRNMVSSEWPALDISIDWIPFQYIHSSSILIKRCANASFFIINGNTSLISPLMCGHVPAIVRLFACVEIGQTSIGIWNTS